MVETAAAMVVTMPISDLSDIEDLIASGDLELVNRLCDAELHRLRSVKDDIVQLD